MFALSNDLTINGGTTAHADQKGYEWMDTEMTNVITNEKFTLNELTKDGTPVVLHLIATWCPACNTQFEESTKFLENYPGKAHVVLIGIDSRETPALIANHVATGGYAGIFTTPEDPVMQGLIDLFGPEAVMSIPQTIIIRGDNLEYLGPGAIRAPDIASRIDEEPQQRNAAITDQKGNEWMNTEMTDVITGDIFTLRQLADEKPVAVHLIATWCPACNTQFEESTKFLENYPEKASVVLIGIDSRETPALIAGHASNRGYAGIFTTAEAPVIQGFIDLFGPEAVMSIPQTIIIHGDDLAYLGPGAIRSADIASRIDAISQQLRR
jgi:thiol-disulfide isomerase/thioredoxin